MKNPPFLKLFFFLTCLLFSKNIFATQTTAQNNIEIIVLNDSKTHAFKANKPVKLLVWVKNLGTDTLRNVNIKCAVLGFKKNVIQTRELLIAMVLPQKKSDSLVFEFNIPTPGFYYSNVTSEQDFNQQHLKGFSVEPEKIKSPYPAPKDFTSFWQQTLKELQQVPPQYKVTLRTDFDNPKTDVYSVEMMSLGNVQIHGWLVVPKGKRDMPTIIYFQGYTTTNTPSKGYLNITDFAQFLLDIRGHGSSRKDVNPGFPAFLTQGVEDKEHYIFRGAYMDCIRTVDFLCTRPEVNHKQIIAWGGSMGGALSLVTAALDKRVRLCAFDLPFLSDFRNYFTLTGFPAQFFQNYSTQNNRPMDSIHTVLDYFDIKNFAPLVKCPTMMASGLFDETCPSAINFAAYNNLKSKDKEFHLMPDTGHAITNEYWYHFYDWSRQHLKKKKFRLFHRPE